MAAPDACPKCNSFNSLPLNEDGSRYDLWKRGQPLWSKFRCMECGHEWPFKFISVREASHE